MLPLDSYSKDRRRSDGLRYYCRTCGKAQKQKYRQSDKGKLTEQQYDRRPSLAKYAKSQKFQATQRRYRQSEKGKAMGRLRMQRLRKTEAVKRYEQQFRKSEKRRAVELRYDTSAKGRLAQKRYRQTEKHQVSMQLYRAAHKAISDKYLRAWLRTSEWKEYMARRNFQRRAAVLRTPPHQLLTLSEWREIKLRFHNACAYCGVPESSSMKLTRDHLTPVTRGGLHTKENIVPACQPCNARKGAKLLV